MVRYCLLCLHPVLIHNAVITPIETTAQMNRTMPTVPKTTTEDCIADSLGLIPVVVVVSSVGVALSERDAVLGVEECCTVGDG